MSEALTLAPVGHNNPPEATPFEAFEVHIGDLFEEAKNHLDGAGISSEAEAEAVSKLLDLIRTAAKDADKARAEEKRSHDDAGKAVQAKWRPMLDRAELAVGTCKQALAPWLHQKAEAARVAAEAARVEAERQAAEAQAAMQSADVTDLAAREQAEAMVKTANKANTLANKAEKVRPHATGGARAITLRSYWKPAITDASAALRHYVAERPGDLKDFLLGLAEQDVREGKRSIPGFEITEEKRVA